MALQKDFLTNVADAFLVLFRSDAQLGLFNWEEWDSDKQVKQPRGYFSAMRAATDVEETGPMVVKPVIVLEGKPKRQKLSAIMFRLEQIVWGAGLADDLNAAANGTVMFYHRAESVVEQQNIEGDLRKRSITFEIRAIALLTV